MPGGYSYPVPLSQAAQAGALWRDGRPLRHPDGCTVEVVQFEAGKRLRVCHHGFYIADVRRADDLARWIPADELAQLERDTLVLASHLMEQIIPQRRILLGGGDGLDVTEPMPNVVRMALLLPGWDRYSVWGWDAAGGHVFARLWGNADDPDMPPTIRIGHGGPGRDGAFSGGSPLNVDGLAELIATATGTGVRHVLLAMGAGAPEALEARLLKLAADASPSARQQPFAS